MTKLFPESQLPPQNLKHLSFCGSKPKQLLTWLNELPSKEAGPMSTILYKLLPEVCQLKTSPAQRLELLQILGKEVNHCVQSLTHQFIKQALKITETMARTAAIAQALQRHLCDGYLIVLEEVADKSPNKASTQLRTQAIYSGLDCLGELFLRSCQLYAPRPPQFWLKAHRLYELAKTYGVHQQAVEERENCTPEQRYFRILLLDCSNTNQLKPDNINQLYQLFASWASLIHLTATNQASEAIYWLSSETDEGPFFKSRYRQGIGDSLLAIEMGQLVKLLDEQQYAASPIDEFVDLPAHTHQPLITHLLTCWRKIQERQHKRFYTATQLDICIGLKAAHHELLHGKPFDAFIHEGNPDIDIEELNEYQSPQLQSTNRTQVLATDVNEHGFCLRWEQDVPSQLKNGECILLREPDAEHWQLGSIRWAKRLNQFTYVGVQILAKYAEACAASALREDGSESPYFRIISLRENADSPYFSLVTPNVPFCCQQTIDLVTQQQHQTVKLTQLMLNSGNISQFAYQQL